MAVLGHSQFSVVLQINLLKVIKDSKINITNIRMNINHSVSLFTKENFVYLKMYLGSYSELHEPQSFLRS
jgi:hypothetical protein